MLIAWYIQPDIEESSFIIVYTKVEQCTKRWVKHLSLEMNWNLLKNWKKSFHTPCWLHPVLFGCLTNTVVCIFPIYVGTPWAPFGVFKDFKYGPDSVHLVQLHHIFPATCPILLLMEVTFKLSQFRYRIIKRCVWLLVDCGWPSESILEIGGSMRKVLPWNTRRLFKWLRHHKKFEMKRKLSFKQLM